MEELLNCDVKQFKEIINNISSTKQLAILQEILQGEISKLEKQKHNYDYSKLTLKDANESEKVKELLEKVLVQGKRLKRKKIICEERLISLQISEKEELEKQENEPYLKTVSWGLVPRKQPEILFKEKCQYRSDNRIKIGSVSLSECGIIIYREQPNIEIDELCMDSEAKKDALKLVKLELLDDNTREKIRKMYILMSIDDNLNYSSPEAREVFQEAIKIFLSKSYMDKVKFSKQCTYGGKIVETPEGDIDFNLEDKKQSKVVRTLNCTFGTTRTEKGKKMSTLGTFVEMIDKESRAITGIREEDEGR